MKRERIGAFFLGCMLAAMPASAATTTEGSAAILIYPYVVVDPPRGRDTLIQITNTADAVTNVSCRYLDTSGICQMSTHRCLATADCVSPNLCVADSTAVAFNLRLTPRQPLAWRISTGLSVLPLETGVCSGNPALPCTTNSDCPNANDGTCLSNAGTVVPADESLLQGYLTCYVTDDAGAPVGHNAIVGQATLLRRLGSGDALRYDSAEYAAAGIPARQEGNGDDVLTLGGPLGEYEECPSTLRLMHSFDGVSDLTNGRNVFTTLVVVPCAADLAHLNLGNTNLGLAVYDECLGLNNLQVPAELADLFCPTRMTTSVAANMQLVKRLSALDSSFRTRSFFYGGADGMLERSATGATDIFAIPGGAVGVAIEEHENPDDPQDVRFAALQLDSLGERGRADLLTVGSNAPASPTPTAIVASTPTPSPASIGPEIVYFGLVTPDSRLLPVSNTDAKGDPIYRPADDVGFSIVIEARPGISHSALGTLTSNPTPTANPTPDPAARPDIQILSDRALGDGNASICDDGSGGRPFGGVPAINPPTFDPFSQTVADALNDFGCRFIVRLGCVLGTNDLPLSPSGGTSSSLAQACTFDPIGSELRFPPGDTALIARWRDQAGNLGPQKRIVVRIQ